MHCRKTVQFKGYAFCTNESALKSHITLIYLTPYIIHKKFKFILIKEEDLKN